MFEFALYELLGLNKKTKKKYKKGKNIQNIQKMNEELIVRKEE